MDELEQEVYLKKFQGGEVTLNLNESTGIAYMCLKRPEKKNAMSGSMMIDLKNKIEMLENWKSGKGLIFYGEGNFCSGGDLTLAKQTGDFQGAFITNAWMTTTLQKLKNLKLISVCIISGATLGGGAEISTFCDYILATEDVKFGFVHAKMGIVTAWGGGTSLVKRIGYKSAMDLMLTSRILSADECLNLGLAADKLSNKHILEEAEKWLTKRILMDASIIRAIKDICLNADALSFEDSINEEKKVFYPFWGSERNKNCLEKRIKHVQHN